MNEHKFFFSNGTGGRWKGISAILSFHACPWMELQKKLKNDSEFIDNHLLQSLKKYWRTPSGQRRSCHLPLLGPTRTDCSESGRSRWKPWKIQGILSISDDKDTKSEAIHVVVGIQYGAEAYCAITFGLEDKEEDEAFREEAPENVTQIAKKFQDALDAHHDVVLIQRRIDRRGDCCSLLFQNQTEIFEAYNLCCKLVDRVQ